MDNIQRLSIDEIHLAVKKTLEKLIEICDELNVEYLIAFGSLIGTIRHEGYIPWDDDLDIIMLRKDYDILCDYCDKHDGELMPFKLMNRHNTKDYPFNIARFNDTRYGMISTNEIPDAGMGAFIDIYPFDNAGDNEKCISKWFDLKKDVMSHMWYYSYEKNPLKNGRSIKNIIKYPLWKYASKKGSTYFLEKLESLKDTFKNEGEYVALMVWDAPTVVYKKSYFDNKKLMPFEDIFVMVPEEYDKMLTSVYGDYMKLPPVEQRKASHDYILYKKNQNCYT